MSREEIEKFLTDEGRAKVERFMADSDGEDDDVDMDEVVRQNLADHAAAMGDSIEAGPGEAAMSGSNDELWPLLVDFGAVSNPDDLRDSDLRRALIHWRNASSKDVAKQYHEMRADRDAATDRAVKAESEVERKQEIIRDANAIIEAQRTDLAELRERIGEATVEWAVYWRSVRDHYEICETETEAREAFEPGDPAYEVRSRVVGEWKVADGGQ